MRSCYLKFGDLDESEQVDLLELFWGLFSPSDSVEAVVLSSDQLITEFTTSEPQP